MVKGCSGDTDLCCVALEKRGGKGEGRVGRNRELAVDSEKLATLHMVGGGGLLWKMKSLRQL